MVLSSRKISNFLLLLILNLVIYIYTREPSIIFSSHLRKNWEEVVRYDSSHITDTEEKKSLEKCEDSDYKYFIHFVSGNDVTFERFINKDNAVST